jgi:hypothetical protein
MPKSTVSKVSIPSTTISLYESDLNLWLENEIAHLRAGDLHNLDIENLIEELEGLAGRDRRELKNRLRLLLEHLLKRLYVDMPQEFNGWERTIREQRSQIKIIFEQSPSLKSFWENCFESAWGYALYEVQENYSQCEFPRLWQFSRDIDTMLNAKLWIVS